MGDPQRGKAEPEPPRGGSIFVKFYLHCWHPREAIFNSGRLVKRDALVNSA